MIPTFRTFSSTSARASRAALAVLLLTVAFLPLVPQARAADEDDFVESRSPWAVAPPVEANEQRGVERDGTLRVIRFSNDRQILNDKGTVVGFASIVARTGQIPRTHEQPLDEKSLLEIMRRGSAPRE